MDISNWINLGILFVTALVGILAWLGARNSAREAKDSQDKANDAANRAADAAEALAKNHARLVEIENQRETAASLNARRASLRAKMINEQVTRYGGPRTEQYLTITNESGQAMAQNVRILINGKPIAEYAECKTALPPNPPLGPHGELKLLIKSVGGGTLDRSFGVKLVWDDESAENQKWEGQMSW